MKGACVALAAAVLGLAGRAAGISLTNDYVVLTIAADGLSVSMQERATGRQLLANPRPFVRVAFADGTEALPRRMTDLGGGRLRFELKDGRGTADVSVKPQPWGFVFTAEDLEIQLSASVLRSLMISKVYYSGTRDNMDRTYTTDSYVEIFNNSDEVAYLDGMYLALAESVSPAAYPAKDNPDSIYARQVCRLK